MLFQRPLTNSYNSIKVSKEEKSCFIYRKGAANCNREYDKGYQSKCVGRLYQSTRRLRALIMLAGVILLLCVAASSAFHAAVRDSKTVKVTMFYEAMDPQFRDFINNQFSPHWEQIEEGIEVELVPFGKTNATYVELPEPHIEFSCTRGPEECTANKLHACVIKKMHQHKLKMMKVIKCLMNKKDQMDGLPDCLDEIHIKPDAHKFIDCVNSPDTDYLVVQHGIRTQKMFPKKLDSLPKIVFNDLWNKRDQALAFKDFKKLICRIVFDLCEEKNIKREITLQL